MGATRMSGRVAAAFGAALVLAASAATCSAASRSFLESLPSSHMTEEDRRIAMATINSALDEGKAGSTYRWDNPATKASGSITPQQPFSQAGMTCRSAEIDASAGGQRNITRWKLCKTPEGWKILE